MITTFYYATMADDPKGSGGRRGGREQGKGSGCTLVSWPAKKTARQTKAARRQQQQLLRHVAHSERKEDSNREREGERERRRAGHLAKKG